MNQLMRKVGPAAMAIGLMSVALAAGFDDPKPVAATKSAATKKHSKGARIPYVNGKNCLVTIDGGKDVSGNYVFKKDTQIAKCKLFDSNKTFVADWVPVPGQKYYLDGKLTILFRAKGTREKGDRAPATGYIVVTTLAPDTETDPGTLTTEPVDIDPCIP